MKTSATFPSSNIANHVGKVAKVAKVVGFDVSAAIDPRTEIELDQQKNLDRAMAVLEETLAASDLDPSLLFNDRFILAAQTIQTHTQLWEAYRARIKAKNSGIIRMAELDKVTMPKPVASDADSSARNSAATELVAHTLAQGKCFLICKVIKLISPSKSRGSIKSYRSAAERLLNG